MRVVGVVAGTNVMRGLPRNRTTTGAALVDTAGEVATGIGFAVSGTILAGLLTGDIAASEWSAHQTAEFRAAVMCAGLALTVVAAALVGWGIVRARSADNAAAASAADPKTEQTPATVSSSESATQMFEPCRWTPGSTCCAPGIDAVEPPCS
jgi:hypothetical protein